MQLIPRFILIHVFKNIQIRFKIKQDPIGLVGTSSGVKIERPILQKKLFVDKKIKILIFL